MKDEALKLADELEADANKILDDLFKSNGEAGSFLWNIKVNVVEEKKEASAMIRRLVEELDKKQQGLVEASAMLFNYKYELDLERVMSANLKEELEKQK